MLTDSVVRCTAYLTILHCFIAADKLCDGGGCPKYETTHSTGCVGFESTKSAK